MFLCCSTGDPILSALACVFTFSVTWGLLKVQDYVCHISVPQPTCPVSQKEQPDWLLIMTEDTNHHPLLPMSGAQTLKATGSLNRFNFPSCKCCLYWLWLQRTYSWPDSWGPSAWNSLFNRDRRASCQLKFFGKCFLKWAEITGGADNCQFHLRK